jgi:hypothetical protein
MPMMNGMGRGQGHMMNHMEPQGGQGEGQEMQGQGGQGKGGSIITAVDEGIGTVTQALSQIPQVGPGLAQKMDEVRKGYRSVVEEAMAASQGGGAAPGSQQRQGASRPQAVPERSQGTPVGPGGAY